ncbi:MAG TPA: glycine betaine ABC transporter substrate-binding protein [Gryllotalpicola sp.]
MNRRLRRALAAASLALAAMTALAGCGLQPAASFVPAAKPGSIQPVRGLPADASVIVTSKNFTEQILLGKIAVLALTAAGFQVTDMTNVPGSQAVRQLMLDHGADVDYDYTGTAWLTYLGETTGIPDQTEQYEAVRKADAANGLSWLPVTPMNDTYALAIRAAQAKKLGVTTLSDIAKLPVAERTFCVESEFNSRPDGFRPMLKKYGLELGGSGANGVPTRNVKVLDTGTVYTATAQGKCNFGEVFTTDGRIGSLHLTVLDDDQHFFPAYNGAPIVNTQTLKRYPQIATVLNDISPRLTNDALVTLNRKVDVEGQDPGQVAFDWLVGEGFLKR